jgi:alcohol dehydrogenase
MSGLFAATRGPRTILFGSGQRHALAGQAVALGQRALVITDMRLSADAEFKALCDGLTSRGVAVAVYDGVLPELPLESLLAGVDTGRAHRADLVIGIGGGSCLDAAKVVALLLAHGGTPSDYYGEFKVPGPVLPLILLPTTSGTGSEVTPVAVVADPDRALKVGIASPHLISQVAICDPDLTLTCPPGLTAISGADALTHAIEAFTNAPRAPSADLGLEHVFLGKNALSDAYALLAIENIAQGLQRACADGSDRDAREKLMFGAMTAGLAFGTAGTAAAHAIQYPVGAMTHTAHGLGVAVMLPYVMEFNRNHALHEMAAIAKAMGVDVAGLSVEQKADAAIEAVAALFAAIGIPSSLQGLKLPADQVDAVATQALGITRLIKNNPRPLDAEGMGALVKAAFAGDRAALRG